MSTETPVPIPAEVLTDMEQAVKIAYSNVRDPERMKQAAERMDRLREKNAKLYPGPDIGVEIIREMRDGRHFQGNA